MSYNFFAIKKAENNIVSINKYSPNNIDVETVIVCSDTFTFDENTSYECEFIKFSHSVRKSIIDKFGDTFTSNITDKIFEVYSNFSKHIHEVISSKYDGVKILCCINYYDICIIIPNGKYSIKEISDEIISYLNKEYPEDIIDVDPILEKHNKLKEKIANVNRSFIIKYNHFDGDRLNFEYNVKHANYDNPDKYHELSLIESILLKRCIEWTMSHYIYSDGLQRISHSNELQAVNEEISHYFKNLITFFVQSQDNKIHSDYIWSFRFLFQTLLSSVEKQQATNNFNNTLDFSGFIPIINENKIGDINSVFGLYNSKKFFNSFIELPSDISFNTTSFLPKLIHEFSYYIGNKSTKEENKTALYFIFYSLLKPFNSSLTKEIFEDIIKTVLTETKNIISNTFNTYSEDYYEEKFLNNDFLEFIFLLRTIISNDSYIEELSNRCKFSSYLFHKYGQKEALKILSLFRDKIDKDEDFKSIFSSTINTFTFFFRQIRSDIGMCKFFNLTLAEYIELLAKENMLCTMPKDRCADSIILRFGFMCRYLYNHNLKEIDNEKWFNTCIEIIDSLKEKGCPNDDNFDTKCDNLKDYLKEFVDATIESEDNAYIPKGESIFENLLIDNNIISNWEKGFEVYDNHNFMQFLKDVYVKYMNSDEDEKLKINCSMRVLFRDLYDYNPDLS